MTQGRRSPALLALALVVVLVAVPLTGCARADGGPVPPALVGRWRGGTHSNGPWFYEFDAGGGYRTWPERSPGTVNTGTVVVAGPDVTFSNGGVPVTSTWSLSNGSLLLDGQTYVRA